MKTQVTLRQKTEQHFERYAVVHSERFEVRDGPLRPVVRRVVERYLECGRLPNGFARLRCASCRSEHLLAFSCQTRNFCPSCQAKRAALFAEHVRGDRAGGAAPARDVHDPARAAGALRA